MLIGQTDSDFDYVQRYVTHKYPSIQTKTLIGSTFDGDLMLSNTTYTEQYNTRVLMDIILYAEKEITLFLRGLSHLYDNLYDLFNQNYTVSSEKKYCRIALGSLYHPRCLVNDGFYCVVFVKQEDLNKYDAPFLNRFEKHVIHLYSLIDDRYQNVKTNLTQWMNDLLSNEKVTCAKDLFIWSRPDYLLSLILEAFDHLARSGNTVDDQSVLNYCQNQIVRISSFDLPLLLSLENKNDHQKLIQQYYQIHNDLSLATFLHEEFDQEKNDKLLIYTYTQVYEPIDYREISDNQEWIEEIKLTYCKTELDLTQKIKRHYKQTRSIRLLCIRIDYHEDQQHIPLLKHILVNEYVSDSHCGVCLIFHLQRCELKQTSNDVFFYEWSRVMIDNLQTHQLLPMPILGNPSYGDLITHLDFLSTETIFDEIIHRGMVKFRYIASNKENEIAINDRRQEIIKQLSNKTDQSLYFFLKKHLLDMTQNTRSSKDWRLDLLTDKIVTVSCRSFHHALSKTLSILLEKYFSFLFFHYEKHSLIESYLFLIHADETIRNQIWLIWIDCLITINKMLDMSNIDTNYTEILLVFDLHLPCATTEFDVIRQIRSTIAQNPENSSIDFAYKELINKSIYGENIKDVLNDPGLFDHYYHDQLILNQNEVNVHHLSVSFIQKLIIWKLEETHKNQLAYLLIDYEELIEILRIFEITLPLLGDEDTRDRKRIELSNDSTRSDSIQSDLIEPNSSFEKVDRMQAGRI